jgi:hypothetical protein
VQPYHHGWHIDAIAEHLEAAYRREIRRLIINVPPRHMKSLTVSVFGPAWRWTHAPSERFLTASYGDKLATDHAKNTRTVIQSRLVPGPLGRRVLAHDRPEREDVVRERPARLPDRDVVGGAAPGSAAT